LEQITTTHVKVRQGNSSRFVPAPVNFADLSSEYIGMLYEGLLGYELRTASEGDAIVILNLGDQPALPLTRLEDMDDDALKNLVEKFSKKTSAVVASEEEAEEDDEAEAEDADPEDASAEEEDTESGEEDDTISESANDQRQQIRERAQEWAYRAIRAGKLLKAPKANAKPAAVAEYQKTLASRARQLTTTTYLPGEYYLVRSSGTRKGSGTFYTRPALAIPTAHRTLRPLAFNAPTGEDGKPNELAPIGEWTPKTPEEILALKVCDPACGSASFLVAALRFLTDALYTSLHYHDRITAQGEGALITLAEGKVSTGTLSEETLPARPDDERFEARLKARLRRYVVERCIYGVDYDALAIELARLALWIDTMDRELPFEFLDHKIKQGNALVGTWFDQFRVYPIFAWEREGGDKDRKKFVHHYRTIQKSGAEAKAGDKWHFAIKDFYKNTAKPRYAKWLDGQTGLLDKVDTKDVERQHAEAIRLFDQLHSLPIQQTEERAAFYRDHILGNPDYLKLRDAFDTWCAIWFWPVDQLQDAPVATGVMNVEQMRAIAARVARERRFFHWELEFPDVFAKASSGFDAILGNPPWEISKPNSKEFFSRVDPLYRSYGKQEAIARQLGYFEQSADDERAWIDYNYGFKAMLNWAAHSASPFGDGSAEGDPISLGSGKEHIEYRAEISKRMREIRGFADHRHPFRHQGSADLNLYKMFLETSHAVLQARGRLGMIVPSGVYTDKGTSDLRALFLDRCRWRWLFGLENARKIFDIHRSYKFNPIIVEKGGSTDAILTAFMHRDVRDWEEAERYAIGYTRAQVERFSPKTKALLEIRDWRDLQILEKIYSNALLLGDQSEDGWGVVFTREFHMTDDSALFPSRRKWEQKGYKPDLDGRWIGPDGEVALPLYQGVMIHLFDSASKGWIQSASAGKWIPLAWSEKMLSPQFLMSDTTYAEIAAAPWKIAFRSIARTTDTRSFIGSVVGAFPSGNSLGHLIVSEGKENLTLALSAIVSSLTFDWQLRRRLGGTNVNWYILEETPVLRPSPDMVDVLSALTFKLLRAVPGMEKLEPVLRASRKWDLSIPNDLTRRVVRAQIEAIVASQYGLTSTDFAKIISGCDLECEELEQRSTTELLDPTGFWRVDKKEPPSRRLPNLALAALRDLELREKDVADFVLDSAPPWAPTWEADC
jgi:hypothetical protein